MVFGCWGLWSGGYGASLATFAIPDDPEVLKALLLLWKIIDVNKLLASIQAADNFVRFLRA